MISKEKNHAYLSASGSSRWLNCPGSAKAQIGIKSKSNAYSEEGTIAHELADICLKANFDADKYIGIKISCESNGKILEKVIDKEMARYVQDYLDYVRSFETKNYQMLTEEKVDFSKIVPNGFGTLDSAIIDYDNSICHIFDLKYGKGIEVKAENNTQAQLYALGLLEDLKTFNLVKSFKIHIVQPRLYNFDSWEISIEDLKKFGEYAKERAILALSDNPPIIPGEKQCRWCKANPINNSEGVICESLSRFLHDTILNEFDNLEEGKVLSDEKIRNILDNESLLLDFIDALKQNVEIRLNQGKKFPGYKLVEGRSNRQWIENAKEILEKELGENAYTKKLIGVTEGDKRLGKEKMSELTFKPEGKPVLVKESDKRKPIQSIVNQFNNIA